MALNPDPSTYCLPHYWFSQWLRPSDCTSIIFCWLFSSVKVKLCWYHCYASWEWSGAVQGSQAIFRGKATLTFENNPVAGGRKKKKEAQPTAVMFVTGVSRTFLRWLIITGAVYYRICVCWERVVRISVASDNVSSWALTWCRPLPGKANKTLS